MIKNMVEEHHKETPRGHLLRADIPGPGKVLARYIENGEQTWEEHQSNPDKRCTVNIPKDVDTITLNRPNLYRLNSDIEKIVVASERVFIDANNFHIQLLTAETDKNSFLDTADRIVKILVADAKITVLKFKNVSTIYLVDCKVLTPLLEDVKGFVRIDS